MRKDKEEVFCHAAGCMPGQLPVYAHDCKCSGHKMALNHFYLECHAACGVQGQLCALAETCDQANHLGSSWLLAHNTVATQSMRE